MLALCVLFMVLAAIVPAVASAQGNGLSLTDAERAWLSRHPVVIIPLDEDYPPFHKLQNGNRVGLTVDYLNILSEKTGLNVRFVTMPWPEALQEMSKPVPSVDLVSEITNSPERAQQMLLTRPYLTAPHVIITRKDAAFVSGLKDLSKKTVVMEKEYMSTGWVRRDLPANRIQEVDSTLTALTQVANGKADAYIGNLAVASYLMVKHGLSNLKVAAPSGYEDDALAMGIRKDWPELAAIINKVFSSLSHEEHQQLRQKWFSIRYEHGVTPKQVTIWLLLVVALGLAFIIPLRIMVRNRTRALDESTQLLEAIIDNTLQLQGLLGTDGSILKVNQAALALAGCTEAEVIGRLFWEGPWWKDLPQEQIKVQHAVEQARNGETCRFETFHYAADGSRIAVDFSLRPLTDPTGTVRYLIPEGRDISAIKQSEEKYRHLFETAPIGIFQSLPGGSFVNLNPSFARIFGYSSPAEMMELVTDIPTQLCADPFRRTEVLKQLETCDALTAEEVGFIRKDGSRFCGTLYLHVIRYKGGAVLLQEGFLVDTTERKLAQDLMIQNEKMTMVAGLSAGIAHEINNPLGIIVQDLQLLERRLNPGLPVNQEAADAAGIDLDALAEYLKQREIHDFLANMREAGRRASTIVKSMLQFGRTGNQGKQPADINRICEQAITLASADYDLKKNYDFKNITITRAYCSALPLVPVVVGEIEQVLINLLKNAAHALFSRERADLPATIEVCTACSDSFAEISVRDNGPGIPEAIRTRIFEPFFTTKEVGIGTGLGLAVSYAIITDRHGGTLRVECPREGGSRFIIQLPHEGHERGQLR